MHKELINLHIFACSMRILIGLILKLCRKQTYEITTKV